MPSGHFRQHNQLRGDRHRTCRRDLLLAWGPWNDGWINARPCLHLRLIYALIPESNKDYLPAWKGHLCPCSISVSALLPEAPPMIVAPLRLWLSDLCTVAGGSLQRGQQTPSGCHYPASRRVWKKRQKTGWLYLRTLGLDLLLELCDMTISIVWQ